MSRLDISFIIPCYNAGSYLEAAIESILAQKGDFEIVEIIVVDDRSDDPATKSALATVARLEKVKVVANTGPKGAAGARNAGLDIARGEWIAFFDADDVLTENAVQSLCMAARSFPDCGWVGGDFLIWHPDGTYEPGTFLRSRPRPARILGEAFETDRAIMLARPVEQFLQAGLTNMCTSMILRRLMTEIGGFDTSLKEQEDYNFFLRLAADSDFVFVPRVVMHYRQRYPHLARPELDNQIWRIKGFLKLLKESKFHPYKKSIRSQISQHYLGNVYYYRDRGSFFDAIRSSISAIYHMPSSRKAWRALAGSLLGR